MKKRASKNSLLKRVLAAALSVFMMLGVVTVSTGAASDKDLGTFSAVAGFAEPSFSTSGDTVTAEFAGTDIKLSENAYGNKSYWVGVYVTAPEDADLNTATITKIRGGASTEFNFAANTAEGSRGIGVWFDVKPDTITTENSMTYTFDWDGDGVADEKLNIKVDPTSVRLMDGEEQVYPAYCGTFSAVPNFAAPTIKANNSGMVIGATFDNVVIDYSVNALGKGGYWVGVFVDAPTNLADISNATVTKNGGTPVSFKENLDTETGLGVWFEVEPATITTNNNIEYAFDWDGDGTNDQRLVMQVLDNVILMKDGVQVYPNAAPVISNITTADKDKWTTSKEVSFNVTDINGDIDSVYVSTVNVEVPDKTTLDADNLVVFEPTADGKYSFIINEEIDTAGTKFYIYAFDADGRYGTGEATVAMIDTTEPVINDVDSNNWHWGPVKYTTYWIIASDSASGVDRVECSDDEAIFTTYNNAYGVSVKRGTKPTITVVDKAGNTTVYNTENSASFTFNIINKPEKWAQSGTIEFTVEAINTTIKGVYYSTEQLVKEADKNNKAVNNIMNNGILITLEDGAEAYKIKDITANGDYYIYVIGEDNSFDDEIVTVDKIDTTAPTIESVKFETKDKNGENVFVNNVKEFLHKISFGYLFCDKIVVTVNANDRLEQTKEDSVQSGIVKYEYEFLVKDENGDYVAYKSDSAEVSEGEGSYTFEIPFEKDAEGNEDFEGTLKVKVYDNVGLVSEEYAEYIKDGDTDDDVLLVDFAQPGAPIANTGYTGEWTNQQVTYAVAVDSANIPASGIERYEYKIVYTYSSDNRENVDWTIMDSTKCGSTLSQKNIITDAVIPDTITLGADNTEIEGTIYFRAVSNSGVIGTEKDYAFKIDMIAPEFNVSYDNNSADSTYTTFYNNDRTATITVTEKDFNLGAVTVEVTKDEQPVSVSLNWTNEGDIYTANYPYTTDGDYTFKFAYTDKAGNASANNGEFDTEFTIDKTAPVITVSYDNNGVANGFYFNAARTATVTVVEHNFDSARANITVTASRGGEQPKISGWSTYGDRHTATVTFTADGDYTFNAKVTDKAGNANSGVNYGGSAAPESFTIDTTYDEMVGFDGVQSGNAYKDEIAPEVAISDINLDTYKVTLVGQQKGKTIDLTAEVNALLKESTIMTADELQAKLVSGTLDVFPNSQEYDGIYTLTITSTDLAGNKDTEEIKFTVNRFGSVYEYDEYLSGLVADGGAYVTTVDKDIVIKEYNADKLVADSLKIEITCDGRPVENVIFEVNPEINDQVATGGSGWYEYTYIISKDNFTEDGVYTITVSSKDATGNVPENNAYEDMGITFRVDKTAPTITSIAGLEEEIINASEVTVRYTVFDAIGLSAVKVYVDGELVSEITEFDDVNNYEGSFVIYEKSYAQKVQIVVEDITGNVTDTDAETFESTYVFHDLVTVSTNLFVRLYANKGLFFGSIGGIVVLAGIIIALLTKRKKATV